MQSKLRVLSCVGPKGPAHTASLFSRIQPSIDQHTTGLTFCKDFEEYEAIADRHNFDVILVQLGTTHAGAVLKDQVTNSKALKWVHSLSSGVDGYVACQEFRESNIPLTNAKGVFSGILGEFVAAGVLYHTKHLRRFMERQIEHKWEIEPMDIVANKKMVVVGYGDIGAACAKIAKNGFDMKVVGVKRNPKECSDLYRSYVDDIVGITPAEYQGAISDADFVVGVLPKVADTETFFSTESTFQYMKPSSVFMNIGRGPTCVEADLVQALKDKKIAGAVMDVF